MKGKRIVKKNWLKTQHSKTKIMVYSCITSWQIDGKTKDILADFIFLIFKLLWLVTAAMKLRDVCFSEEKQ